VLIAADPAWLARAAGATVPSLDKWIQVPLQIGTIAARANYATLVRAVLERPGVEEQQVREAGTSAALGPRIEALRQSLPPDPGARPGSQGRGWPRFRAADQRGLIRPFVLP
jgi:hypothetical protein